MRQFSARTAPHPPEFRGLRWAFIGDQGLRAGWSVALFILLALLFLGTLGSVAIAYLQKSSPCQHRQFFALQGDRRGSDRGSGAFWARARWSL